MKLKMKRLLGLVLSLVLILTMLPTTLFSAAETYVYLDASLWDVTDVTERYAAYFYRSGGETWVNPESVTTEGYYKFKVPSGYSSVIFCRMNGEKTENNWDNRWEQTGNLTITSDSNLYRITSTDNSSGKWDGTYTDTSSGGGSGTGDSGTTETTETVIYVKTIFDNSDWNAGGTPTVKIDNGNETALTYVEKGVYSFIVTGAITTIKLSSDNGNNTATLKYADRGNSNTIQITAWQENNGDGSNAEWADTNYVPKASYAGKTIYATGITDPYVKLSSGDTPIAMTPVYGAEGVYTYTFDKELADGTTFTICNSDGTTTYSEALNSVTESTPLYTYSGSGATGTWGYVEIPESEVTIKLNSTSTSVYLVKDGVKTPVTLSSDGTFVFDLAESYDGIFVGTSETVGDSISYNEIKKQFEGHENTVFVLNYNSSDNTCTLTYIEYSTVYVDTDLVDYLNNNRVTSADQNKYSNNNEGSSTAATNAPFSYLNRVISEQGYSLPLYFGPLYWERSRYGKDYNGDAWLSLSNWNTGANVAPVGINGNSLYEGYDISVQGLVYGTLKDASGNVSAAGDLYDPSGELVLPYFSESLAADLKSGGYNVMEYYKGLKFPFISSYDSSRGVTTYSYDSENDYAVYYDYTNEKLYTSNKYVKNDNGKNGYFPLNEPEDVGSERNMGVGTKFTIEFTVCKDGIMADGQPVEFNFTGDDDVWVFVDGYLVLDMGGAHTKAEGSIDFKNLNATVEKAYTVNKNDTMNDPDKPTYLTSSYTSTDANYKGTGDSTEERDKSTYGEVVTPFPTALYNAFKEEYESGKTEVHTLTMFYMERGMLDSNMSIDFTISPIPSGLTVSKDIAGVNAGLKNTIGDTDNFIFDIAATKAGSSVLFDGYTLTNNYNESSSMTATKLNDTTVRVTGVTDNTYAHSFMKGSVDAFEAETSFIITESLPEKPVFSYVESGTTWNVYDKDNGYASIIGDDVGKAGKTATFAMTDADDADENDSYNYAVNFVNTIEAGTIILTKAFEGIAPTGAEFEFKILIDLDGKGEKFNEFKAYPGLVYTYLDASGNEIEGYLDKEGNVYTAVLANNEVAKDANGNVKYKDINNNEYTAVVDESTSKIVKDSYGYYKYTATIDDKTVVKYINIDMCTDANGQLRLTAGQTVKIEGIPAGAEVTVQEVTTSGAGWVVSGDSSKTITVNKDTVVDGQVVIDDYNKITITNKEAGADSVVIDFGLPVDINVLENDTLGDDAELVSVDSTNVKYGDVTFTEGGTTVRYTPKKASAMTMNACDTFTYIATYDNGTKTLSRTVTVIPAANIYFEDTFLSFTNALDSAGKEIEKGETSTIGAWEVEGTSEEAVQAEDRPGTTLKSDANYVYGYDKAYESFTTFSLGSAHKVTVNAATGHKSIAPKASFTFTGTGFDVISLTDNQSGVIYVTVKKDDVNGEKVTGLIVNNYYGYTYTTDGKWIVDSTTTNGANALYQVPVMKINGLDYGKYYVEIQVVYMSSMDKTGNNEYSFWLDAIRIYDPAKGTAEAPMNSIIANAYADDKESNPNFTTVKKLLLAAKTIYDAQTGTDYVGAMFVDGKNVSANDGIADYENQGPNNEAYLKKGQAIAFQLVTNTDPNASGNNYQIHLGAKLAQGSSAKMNVNDVDKTIKTATNMFYPLDLKWTQSGDKWYANVVIANVDTGDAILSITDLKVTSKNAATFGTSNTGTNVGIATADLMSEESDVEPTITAVVNKEFISYAISRLEELGVIENTSDTEEVNDKASLKFYSISLTGNIAINYYMSLDESLLTDPNAYMVFTMADGSVVRIPVCKGIETVRDKETYYAFTCEVTAKEMTDEIKSQFVYTDGSTKEYSHTVKGYAEYLLANNPKDSLKALLTAMLNYGAAAQKQFGYNTGSLANAGIEGAVSDYDVTLSEYTSVANQGTSNVKFYSASLLLKSETTLRLYFTAESSDFTVSYEGKELNVTAKGNYYYVDITGISARKLDEAVTVIINEGTASADVTYNPMAYCQTVLSDTKGTYATETKNVVAALYLYNQAANAYFGEN